MDKKLIFATVWPSFFFEAAIGHIGIPATYILEGLLLLFPPASFYTTEQWSKDNTKADSVSPSPKGNLQKNILHKPQSKLGSWVVTTIAPHCFLTNTIWRQIDWAF